MTNKIWRRDGFLKNLHPRGYLAILRNRSDLFLTSQRGGKETVSYDTEAPITVGGNTDLSAGVEPPFAPAAQPALSLFPALKGSQSPFPPREPDLHSLCPVWGRGPGC